MKKKVFASLIAIFLLTSCSVPDYKIQMTPSLELIITDLPISQTSTVTSIPTSLPTITSTITPPPGVQVEFYHLRIEYTNTSDWATLEFLNPEIITSMKLIDITGNPQDASITPNILNIYRPVTEIKKNPKASIIFDMLILPDKIGVPIEIRSKHGAINGSGLKVWHVTDNEIVLLQEINHFWVDQKNPDTSAWITTIDLSTLVGQKPNLAIHYQTTPTPKMVWAFYYGWYMPIYSWMWWDNPKWTDRPIQEYASSDPEVIRQQIEQAKSAGIDGFIYATPAINDPALMQNFDTMLVIAEQLDFKILSSIDLLLLNYGPDLKSTVLFNLRTFFKNQYQHPAYIKLNGKPVIQLYAVNKLLLKDWAEIFSALERDGFEGIYLSDGSTVEFDLFQGFYYYAVNGFPDLHDTFLTARNSINYSVLLSDHQEQKLWIATVQPGFDNTPIINDPVTPIYGQSPDIIDRESGDFYRDTWEAAISSDPTWIFITSWNEWQENTCIEPSVLYGDYYLQLTAEYINKWKDH